MDMIYRSSFLGAQGLQAPCVGESRLEREAAPGSGQSSRERARFKTLRKGVAVGFKTLWSTLACTTPYVSAPQRGERPPRSLPHSPQGTADL